ncbi:hypothetical protein FACS189430_04600 [Bacteroidia bacterium]|nr:hypothetical protein FACS189430_04600 [Bacteroidia bacterium]
MSLTFAAAQPGGGQGGQGGQRGNFGTPEERAKQQTTRLDELVKLTADQKTKVEAVNLNLSKKQSAALQNNSDREAMRTKMQEFNTERDKKYKEILTAEQYKKYTENAAQMRRGRGQGQGGGQRGQGDGNR